MVHYFISILVNKFDPWIQRIWRWLKQIASKKKKGTFRKKFCLEPSYPCNPLNEDSTYCYKSTKINLPSDDNLPCNQNALSPAVESFQELVNQPSQLCLHILPSYEEATRYENPVNLIPPYEEYKY
nr:uncharacterized protein LOC100202043 isoform X2 [Hydra vulgaris]